MRVTDHVLLNTSRRHAVGLPAKQSSINQSPTVTGSYLPLRRIEQRIAFRRSAKVNLIVSSRECNYAEQAMVLTSPCSASPCC